ncbi:hypothetical protein M011DRAFT_388827, partial [Sporormia fimetaria CBS 119925]
QRLKAVLWYAIGQYVDEESIEKNINATPQFIGALTELVWTQIAKTSVPEADGWTFQANTSRDLELFAKHAGRKVIQAEDVLLLARRNEELEEMLQRELERIRAQDARDAAPAKNPRGRPPGKATAKGK